MVDAPNENISTSFKTPSAEALDRQWLDAAVKELQRMDVLGKQNENPFSLPLPWETKAKIKALKKAQKVLAEGNGGEVYKQSIEAIEQKIAALSTRLSWTPPKGRQIDFVLDASIYRLAEVLKKKTGAPHWEQIADAISIHLNHEMTANQVLKAHRRFKTLRKDKEKFRRVVATNAKFLITKDTVKQRIEEMQTGQIP